jgi:hypothetical protein
VCIHLHRMRLTLLCNDHLICLVLLYCKQRMLTCVKVCSRCRRELLGSGRAAKSTSSLIQAASIS